MKLSEQSNLLLGNVTEVKAGDLVRVKNPRPTWISPEKIEHIEYEIGVLISYESWEKVATVLLGQGLKRIRAEYVQKAGKRDGLK